MPTNEHAQAQRNQFVLILFHMARGNTIAKRCHLLNVQECINLIANDDAILYASIIPIRPDDEGQPTVTLPF